MNLLSSDTKKTVCKFLFKGSMWDSPKGVNILFLLLKFTPDLIISLLFSWQPVSMCVTLLFWLVTQRLLCRLQTSWPCILQTYSSHAVCRMITKKCRDLNDNWQPTIVPGKGNDFKLPWGRMDVRNGKCSLLICADTADLQVYTGSSKQPFWDRNANKTCNVYYFKL